MDSDGFKSSNNIRQKLRNKTDDFAAILARKVATINPNKESSSLNGKRKVLDSVENSKTITKIREWDLPKLEQNNHEPYSQTLRHKKRKSTNNFDNNDHKPVKIEPTEEPTNNNDPITPPPAAAASKTIDDLFKKTVAKPSIYWAPKEKYLTQTQIIENIVAGLVDSIVASMETVKQVETTINESHSNENETTKKAFALNLSDLISNNIKTHEININCFDNGTLIAVYYENKQVVCSIIDKDKLEIKNSIKIPVLNSEINLNLRKYKNLIYLSFNTPNGSVIKIVDDHLNMLDEIIFSQGVSRLLGINDLFIFFKPELSNIKLESRIYIYDRKLKTKKAVGQCNSPLRPFFFSKSTVQLESLNNKFICLDSDDTFKIIDELSGIVLYSIRLKEAKQFLLSSQQEIILLTDKTLTYFTLDGYLDKQTTLDDKLFEELICFFNDCHDNIYLFERNQFILHKF